MNLLRHFFVVSFITFISRLLGFIRDAILAIIFGSGISSDAFFVAFRIPNLLRRIFAEGAFLQSFIPILINYKNNKKKEAIRIFISRVSGALISILLILIFLGIITAPWIIKLIAPGFSNKPEKLNLTITLLKIIFPYILFISLTSLVSAILNVWNIFYIPALSPILLNISIIGFTLLSKIFVKPSVTILAWSILFGGIIQLFYQLPFLKKNNILTLPSIYFYDSIILKLLRKMGPSIISVSINQISLIINTIFSSLLVSGSITWMYYADRLIEFPIGIFSVAIYTVLAPALSNSFNKKNFDEYSYLLDWGLRICFILILPSSLVIGIMSYPLTITLFKYGKFSLLDINMIQHILIIYTIGIIGFSLVKVFTSGFYSCYNVKTPMHISVLTVLITQIMNLIFIKPFQHIGLSLSISLSACFNAALLFWQIRKKKIFIPQPGWLIFFVKLILALLCMTIVMLFFLYKIPDWLYLNIAWRIFNLIFILIIGSLVYFFTLWLTGFRLYQFTNLRNLKH